MLPHQREGHSSCESLDSAIIVKKALSDRFDHICAFAYLAIFVLMLIMQRFWQNTLELKGLYSVLLNVCVYLAIPPLPHSSLPRHPVHLCQVLETGGWRLSWSAGFLKNVAFTRPCLLVILSSKNSKRYFDLAVWHSSKSLQNMVVQVKFIRRNNNYTFNPLSTI